MNRTWIAAGAVALAVLVAAFQVVGSDPDIASIEGRWMAVSGRHEGLLFEVTCERVLLLQQGDTFVSYRLEDIAMEKEPTRKVYSVEFALPGGGTDKLRLVDGGSEPRAVYLNRSPTPWVLAPDAETPWDATGLNLCRDSIRARAE